MKQDLSGISSGSPVKVVIGTIKIRYADIGMCISFICIYKFIFQFMNMITIDGNKD